MEDGMNENGEFDPALIFDQSLYWDLDLPNDNEPLERISEVRSLAQEQKEAEKSGSSPTPLVRNKID